jgi:hypothetical protein
LDGLLGGWGRKGILKGREVDNDLRRHGVIEVRYRPGPPAIYRLTIGGELWAAVEWSPSRQRWCVEDAAGRCLAHVEHIHAEDVDRETAIRLAKRMIRDGRIPTPEEAEQRWRRREHSRSAGSGMLCG